MVRAHKNGKGYFISFIWRHFVDIIVGKLPVIGPKTSFLGHWVVNGFNKIGLLPIGSPEIPKRVTVGCFPNQLLQQEIKVRTKPKS